MNRTGSWAACAAVAAALAVTVAGAPEDTRILGGHYTWNGGGEGDLEAEFVPTGDAVWDVSFRFTFSGQDHTFSGTAKGSLTEGALEGRVASERGKRTFTFDGVFKEGKFRGTHAEIENGKAHKTGALTLAG